MNLLEVRHLQKAFDNNTVLRDISFEVQPGTVVSIIGPSGSGKSTLLRCMTMLETVDSGEINYGDLHMLQCLSTGKTVYSDKATIKEIKKQFGLVFQSFNLFPHMSVLSNLIEAPVHVLGIQKADAIAYARELLAKVELSDKESAYPCELSGGQQQRVAIARALAMKPNILFFDEPTSALDPELTGEVLKVIKGLKSKDTTMIIVTHEIGFAHEVSDQIIFMDGGVIVEQGSPEDVIDHPQNERTRAFLSRITEN